MLIPLLYETKRGYKLILKVNYVSEFKINLSTSADISYRILPAPHFLIKDSKIFTVKNDIKKSIAEIKDLKVFLYQGNFFNKKKMNIKKIVINHANFSMLRSDFKLLNEFKNKNFSSKKIQVINSNIFFKDNLGEIISIIKIDKMVLFLIIKTI